MGLVRCRHGFVKGLCVVQACPHTDGLPSPFGSDDRPTPTLRACIGCGKVITSSRADYCTTCKPRRRPPQGDDCAAPPA